MSHLSSTLAQAAYRNHDLLTILAQTDYAPPALKQTTSYIGDVKSQIQATDAELAKLHALTENERKDHVSYRDSKVKRFVYKVGGQKGKDKFSAKEQKEEREFLEAWQKEREAVDRREELSRALNVAESDQLRLEQETRRHDGAQSELDQMYASIFSGPTPEVPGEDQQEDAVNQARDHSSRMQHACGVEKQALAALRMAEKCMSSASQAMDRALRYSSWDVMGGGMMADMEERESLSQAQNCVTQADHHLVDTRRLQPGIRELAGVQFPHGHGISDMMFDNIFSDMAQHDRITESDQQVKRALHELGAQVREQQQRLTEMQTQSKQAGDSLGVARTELQRIRAEAFERLAGSANGGWEPTNPPWIQAPEPGPPPY